MLDANKFVPAINPKILETESEPTDLNPYKTAYAAFNHNDSGNIDKDTYASNENYEFCPNCSRKFFVGRLKLHLKSCKEGKPLKIVKSRPSMEHNNAMGETTDITGKSGKETNGVLETAVSFRDMADAHELAHNNYLNPGQNNGGDFTNKLYDASEYQQQENNEQNETEEQMVLDLEGRARNSDGRIECTICHRFFMEDRVLKHESACKKNSKKRPVFDMKKQRELEEGKGILTKSSPDLVKVRARTSGLQKPSTALPKNGSIEGNESKEEIKEHEPEKKLPKWKMQHENFIRNIRFNKQLKEMEANGEDITKIQPPEDLHSDYVPCPHCLRKFNPGTAERHIPKCKNIFNRPKPPRTSKPEDLPNGERTRATFIIKKNTKIAKNLAMDAKNADPDAEPAKFGTVASDQKPKSTVNTYRQNNVSEYTIEEKPKLGSPRDTLKMSDAFGSMRSKIHSQDSAGKQITGLKANAEDRARGTYTSHRAGNNDYRSLSPVNIMSKDGKRMVFMEALPKKEDLLSNYEHIITRSAHYSTEQCPHCMRKFAPRNAERHIPICKNLRYRVMSKTADREFSCDDRTKLTTTNFATKTVFRKKIAPITGGTIDQKVNKGKILLYPSELLENEDLSKEEDKSLGLKIEGTKKIAERPPLPRGKEESQTAPDKFGMKRGKLDAFCVSCGNKMLRMHKFCGNCGSKKADA